VIQRSKSLKYELLETAPHFCRYYHWVVGCECSCPAAVCLPLLLTQKPRGGRERGWRERERLERERGWRERERLRPHVCSYPASGRVFRECSAIEGGRGVCVEREREVCVCVCSVNRYYHWVVGCECSCPAAVCRPRNPKLKTRKPKPETRNPKPETRNPKPGTRNPKPKSRTSEPES